MKDCRRYVRTRKSLGLASGSPGQFLRPPEKGIQLDIINKKIQSMRFLVRLAITRSNYRSLVIF